MHSVEREMGAELFQFSGQSKLTTWSLREHFEAFGWSRYDAWLSHEPVLCFQRIRELADAFPTWQRRARTGRPPVDERTQIIAALVKQFLGVTYRELESYLHVLADFLEVPHVPDANTMSEKNRSSRFFGLLRRFHRFVLDLLPSRRAVIATDATGYGSSKNAWRTTDYGLRATQDWVKSHAAVEVPAQLYLNAVSTSGRVHESRVFDDVWAEIPSNVRPVRSLADAAYTGEECLRVAEENGATPLHAPKRNARHVARPATRYQKLVNFATHWPNRFAALTGPRSHVEAAFSATKQKFGDRLRNRTPISRRNEVQAKQTAHNIRAIVMREQLSAG